MATSRYTCSCAPPTSVLVTVLIMWIHLIGDTAAWYPGSTEDDVERGNVNRALLQTAEGDTGCAPAETPGYDCSQSLLGGAMTVEYTVPAAGDVSVDYSVTSTGAGWVALAWAESPAVMVGAVSVIGRMLDGAGSVEVYDLTSRSSSGVVPSTAFSISETSMTQGDSGTVMTFTRDFDDTFTGTEISDHLVAFHPTSNEIAAHSGSDRSGFALNLANAGDAQIASVKSYKSLFRWHGALLAVAWGVLIPLGTLFARRLSDLGPVWFIVHRACNSLGLLSATAGLIVAVTQFEESEENDVKRHKIIGIVAFVLGWLQVGAILRPGKPAPGEKTPPARLIWVWAHRSMGYLAILLSIINIFLGVDLYDKVYEHGSTYKFVFGMWLLFVLLVALLLEIRAFFVARQEAARKSDQHVSGTGTTVPSMGMEYTPKHRETEQGGSPVVTRVPVRDDMRSDTM